MYKAVICAHNLKEIDMEPKRIGELIFSDVPFLMEHITLLMCGKWKVNQSESITIEISEVEK